MRKFVFAIAAAILIPGLAFAQGIPNSATVVANCGTPPSPYTAGQNRPTLQNTSGQSCGAVIVTPSGTQNTNLTQVNNTTVSTGTGAQGAGAQRVTVATDSATIAGTASAVGHGTAAAALRVELPTDGTGVVGLNAGTQIVGKVGIDQTTPGTTNAVSATNFPTTVATGTGAQGATVPRVTVATDSATVAGSASLPAGTNIIGKAGIDQTTDVTTNGVEIAPTTAAAASPSGYSSASAESNHVVKASAGNVYSIYAYSTASGLFMVFNSTTVPGDGAVTPVECIPVSANNFGAHDLGNMPDQYATGISIAFSTGTNCFSKTASATAMFRVRFK